MESVDNNQFEIKPNEKIKRKITPCPNAYLNPALDLLVNEDPMCNTAMEVVPNKKRKRTRSCDIAAFENSALDLGISKAALNAFLAKELENVRRNVKNYDFEIRTDKENVLPGNNNKEPIYINLTENSMPNETEVSVVNNNISMQEVYKNNVDNVEFESGISDFERSLLLVPQISNGKDLELPNTQNTKVLNTNNQNQNLDISSINNITNIQANVSNQIVINNSSNLSFIDRLALDSPNISSQSLYYDDDLNESNIMEIKTITIITKKKRIPPSITNTNPFLNSDLKHSNESSTTAPNMVTVSNPFTIVSQPEPNYTEEALNRPTQQPVAQETTLMPRRLFMGDTNSTISTVNESSITLDNHEYENVDSLRSNSPIYENIGDETVYEQVYNKQSKVLGYDVSKLNSVDILNKTNQINSSDESNDKRDLKHHLLKASNKFSKKVFKTLKKTFKPDKPDSNSTLNPYEVPRKPSKQKSFHKDTGIENLALNLDNSDDIEMEEIDDDEHQYETVKTLRNTRLNMNVTPLRERCNDNAELSQSKCNTPGKKVRFDSTLNQEKLITGNSFDCGVQSPGFDAKIDKFHDELENCINERKYIQQNM